ncbi:MAG: hypothetical protein ACJAYF_003251 [Arenicella sp.]|jgi:hypothetical protein
MKLDQPFIRLPFCFDVDRLKSELDQFDAQHWMAHPNRMHGNAAIPLVSQNGENNDEFIGHMKMTAHLQRCDYLQQVMASFGEVLARSRLMRLAAKSEVSEHVDFNYHWYSRVRIHIPITTNPDVLFYCGDEKINMQAGECWIFDSWRRHKVVNNSSEHRVHLVVDTSGSSRFWKMLRRMQSLADADIVKQTQLVEYQPHAKPKLRTERFNIAPVMAPGELEAIADALVADFSAYPGNNQDLVKHYTHLLSDLAKDWREAWLLYGYQYAGVSVYQAVLQRAVQKFNPDPRALVTMSNQLGVNPIIMQRIIRAALNPDLLAEFLTSAENISA